MPENFPTTPRAPVAVRFGAIAIGLAALVLATRTTVTSSAWVGQVFPGFMLLDSRVIASVGLAHWSGTRVPGLYQSQVLAVDGAPVATAAEVRARVAALPPGTAVRYLLARGDERREVAVVAQRFSARDWLLLFGAFLVNGTVFLASGLVVWVLRPAAPGARALLGWGTACGLFLLTALDLYGPATFFRLHVVGETMLAPAMLHMALIFPAPHRWAARAWMGYAAALVVLLLYEALLYRPQAYSVVLTTNMACLALATFFFATRLVSEYWRGRSPLARQRVRVMTLGTLFAFGPPAAILLVSALTGGGVGMNLASFTPFLFALSLAYAVVKHDLFEIDAMVKRGAYYLLLTGAVGVAYVAAVFLFDRILRAGALTGSAAFPVLFALVVLLLVNPLGARLQTFVDRVFFRTAYDGAEILAALGRQLAACLEREQIIALVRRSVDEAVPNARTRLFVPARDGALREVSDAGDAPPALLRRLEEGRVTTAFDAVETYPSAAAHEAVRAEMAALEAEIAVPLLLRGRLVGVLTTGAKRSGLFYTAGDAEFLRAVGQQAAIALENARSYEALVDAHARLEARVRERTAQLEAANRELGEAYAEKKAAEAQLVHSEKMASLGRLVAGVAHEISNPVGFIAANVVPLQRRLEQAAAASPPDARAALGEAQDIAAIMARGAERTAAIVKDLRAFSRLGETRRKPVDLHEGLEVSLRLLAPRWRDRITVHRDYGTLPPVECDAGQMNQVFMNVIANACDAIRGEGNVWITTRAADGAVTVTIRDDGVGIPPDVLPRVFDPFFTTKEVGAGTGLGLAITHGVVSAHGGRVEAESPPGGGATVRIVLPVADVLPVRRAADAGRGPPALARARPFA